MLTTLYALVAVSAGITSWFLWKQMLRKFSMLYVRFMKQPHGTFFYSGVRDFGRGPHQRNFVIRSLNSDPYTLTVYIQLGSNMADPFVTVESDENGVAVVAFYVGTGPATIFFEVTPTTEVVASSTEEDQRLTPSISVEPHWFQRGVILKYSVWIARNILGIRP